MPPISPTKRMELLASVFEADEVLTRYSARAAVDATARVEMVALDILLEILMQ